MSNQGGIQAALRLSTGKALDYNGDWLALFDQDGVASGDFNGRMLAWINQTLGTSFSDLPGAQAAYAAEQGFSSWGAMDTLTLIGEGYDVVLLAGQSNMVGLNGPIDGVIDVGDARIKQRASSGGSSGTIIDGVDPLWHPLGQSTNCIGPGMPFAREFLPTLPSVRTLLLVPQATGSTGFTTGVGGSAGWLKGGGYYNAAVTAANAAMAAGSGTNRFIGILWSMSETDQQNGVLPGDFAYYMDTTITDMRADITGASQCWAICIGANLSYTTGWPTRPGTEDALANIGYRLTKTYYVAAGTTSGNDIHFNAADYRSNGTNAAAGVSLISSSTTLPGAPTGLTSGSQTATTVSLSWTAPSFASASMATDYKVEYKATSGGSWTEFVYSRSVATSVTVTGLTASTSYDFRVSAISTPGTGSASSTYTVSTTANPILTWDAALSDAACTFSDDNQDFVVSSGGGWSTARGATRKTAGKWYCEAKLTVLSGTNVITGFADLTDTNAPNAFLGNFAQSGGMFGTTRFTNGFSAGTATAASAPTATLNNVYMFAFDADAGKGWLGVNGSWWGGQDPAAGTDPCWTWSANRNISIAASIYATTTKLEIQPTLNYSAPSGFTQLTT